jgi:hypothetical protein
MRVVLAILLVSCVTASAAPKYTERMFRRAVIEDSTSPFYLLITLHDLKTGTDRVVCTTTTSLLGAIHMEHRLEYDESGMRAAREIALTTPRRRFTFTRRKALENVRREYSDRVLEEVRLAVARLSSAELKRLNPLTHIYAKNGWDAHKAYRDATAHAMLERGILVYMDDRAGGVYVAERRPNQAMQLTASKLCDSRSGCLPSGVWSAGQPLGLAAADLVSR